jgi:hypothetical protein
VLFVSWHFAPKSFTQFKGVKIATAFKLHFHLGTIGSVYIDNTFTSIRATGTDSQFDKGGGNVFDNWQVMVYSGTGKAF